MFYLIKKRIFKTHEKQIRSCRNGAHIYTPSAHGSLQLPLPQRVDDRGQGWARGCQPERSNESQCIYHHCQAGQFVRSPQWAAFLDQRGRSTASLTPGKTSRGHSRNWHAFTDMNSLRISEQDPTKSGEVGFKPRIKTEQTAPAQTGFKGNWRKCLQ